MKQIIAAAAALAALSLASCSEGQADMDEQDRQNQEQEVQQKTQYFLELLSGTLHGEKNSYYYEDITFTPYDSPRDVSGVVAATVNGQAEICAWTESEDPEYAVSPTSASCYYTLEANLLNPIEGFFLYLYKYDPETGQTVEDGVDCSGYYYEDEDAFTLFSYFWNPITLIYYPE